MVFCPVTQEQFTKIDGIRETRYKSLFFMETSRSATQGIFLSTVEGACQYRLCDLTKLKEPK
ncbi:hypothetical protein L873DRAFT_1815667 [Choiromyces venosus 120613-1]|uniref:Uncharacterized protein n=1 Tax=Choiromyces venosus 120613-1 TaxID=1336337 RepID=A0A3N4JI13_9PEZI|nr:hypothetical protein L873DRAFT_1815667 [Choiromyces venosus 120613-1]